MINNMTIRFYLFFILCCCMCWNCFALHEDDKRLFATFQKSNFSLIQPEMLLDVCVATPHTHGRSYLRIVLSLEHEQSSRIDIFVQPCPAIIDAWELVRYESVLSLLHELLQNDPISEALQTVLRQRREMRALFLLTSSDHFASREVVAKANIANCSTKHVEQCSSCLKLGACLMYVVSRPVARDKRNDFYQFNYPGFEFDVHSWPKTAEQMQTYIEQFDERHPLVHKRTRAVWRGSPNGLHFARDEWFRNGTLGNPRARLVAFAQRNQQAQRLLNCKFVSMPAQEREWASLIQAFELAPPIPQEQFAKFKSIIDVDGGGWSARLPRLMLFNSVVLKMETEHDTIYMRELLPTSDKWRNQQLYANTELNDDRLLDAWFQPDGRAPQGIVWFAILYLLFCFLKN